MDTPMEHNKVTVLMPIGPNYNSDWLHEAVDSISDQTYIVNEILFINDGVFIPHPSFLFDVAFEFEYIGSHRNYGGATFLSHVYETSITYWNNPANVGFTAAFNIGMGLALNDLVVYLAADDTLMPTAVERMVQTYLDNAKKDAWYACTYKSSNGDTSSIPNNLAMITKGLWKMVGGYPPAAFVGPDALILSCLLAHAPDRIIQVDAGIPLYWIREHDQQETKIHTWKYVDEMNSIRGKYTAEFKFKEI